MSASLLGFSGIVDSLFDGNTSPRIFSVLCGLRPYAYYSTDFEIGSSYKKGIVEEEINILCVVDEQNVLKAITRLLLNENHNVTYCKVRERRSRYKSHNPSSQ